MRAPVALLIFFGICMALPSNHTLLPRDNGITLSQAFTVHVSCNSYREGLDSAFKLFQEFNEAAVQALDRKGFESTEEFRRLATRFLGIQSVQRAQRGGASNLGTHKDKHRQARVWFDLVDRLLNARGDRGKPYLFCGTDFMNLQRDDNVLVDYKNRPTKDRNGKSLTLREGVENFMNDGVRLMEKSWFFLSDYPHRYYLDFVKTENERRTRELPYPTDSNGRIHPCNDKGEKMFMLPSRQHTFRGIDKRRPWETTHSYGIVLCPRAFEKTRIGSSWGRFRETPDIGVKVLDTPLDEMAIRSLELYAEMFVLQEQYFGEEGSMVTPKAEIRRRRCKRDAEDVCKDDPPTNWHKRKENYTGKLALTNKDGQRVKKRLPTVSTALEAMYLALFDLATPVQEVRPGQMLAIFSPENYAWFAYTVWLHSANPHNHWSSGRCELEAETAEESLEPPKGEWGMVP